MATIIVTYICFNISAGCNYLWRTGKILQRDVCEPDDGEGHNDDDGGDGHKDDGHNDDDGGDGYKSEGHNDDGRGKEPLSCETLWGSALGKVDHW